MTVAPLSDWYQSNLLYLVSELERVRQTLEHYIARAYQGLAILTTNLKDSIDSAFLRRIRFVVKYRFPDVPEREQLWRRIYPDRTPTEGLDYNLLAKLNIAGGNIRNIALNAAFIAANTNEPVMMKHILEAATAEYLKLGRTLTDTEIKGWRSP